MRKRLARWLYPRVFDDLNKSRAAHKKSRAAHKNVWADHRARCDCHDSWDQCPCVEEGHAVPGISWRGNSCSCCAWCSPPSGKPSPFVEAIAGETPND